ncbi:MAG: DNA polymerase domain-containing protein, partial [Micromonosporaceae bacterium]
MAQLRIKAGRHTVEVSKPDKVLFPDDGIAKADLAEYYHQVANRMLPYLRGRPLALERYPDGISHQRVFQKDVPSHFPEWVTRVDVERVKGGTVRQAVADKAAALVYLADQGCVTPHAFLSRHDRLNQPDQLIFDLDPPEGDFEAARRGALTLRGLLCDELGLAAYPKTTGGKGVHVMSPLVRGWGFDRVREFARDAADLLVDRFPDEITTEQRKDKRGGRLFIDVLRNA